MKKLFLILIIFLQNFLNGQIIIDEEFGDWSDVKTGYVDTPNDGKFGVDFGILNVDNDNEYLYLNFTTGSEMNLQNDNDVVLFIDIDNNENTGYNINGIGADISYFFGLRYGFYYRNGNSIPIYHNDIGLITLPTVTSKIFELAIKRKFQAGSYLVNINNKIKVFLVQDVQGGDKIPNENGGFEFNIGSDLLQTPPYSIDKLDENHLRIMSYNVKKDNYFDNEPPYSRLIKAAEPDILCFQEIYNHSSSNVMNKIKGYFGGTWFSSKLGSDLIVVSRYPIVKTASIGGNGAFLIDKNGKDILIINCHLYCCDNDSGRQNEVDEIMNFIRLAKDKKGVIPLEKNTPIIILGDMNFVGKNRQRQTLIQGDIFNESTYGSDFLPDWDTSVFEDAKPITIEYPATFTWNSDYSSYPKGRLDYVIYSGSVLQKENGYVLFTRLMDRDILDTYRLNAEDSDNASDHIPVIVDFSIKDMIATNDIFNDKIKVLEYYPNPIKDFLNIKISSDNFSDIKLEIYTNLGRKIKDYYYTIHSGLNNIAIDVSNIPQGIYFGQVITNKNNILKSGIIKFVVD